MLLKKSAKYWKYLKLNLYAEEKCHQTSVPDLRVMLLVGMVDSPHFIKWLQVVRQEFPRRKLIVFPSDRPRYVAARKILYGNHSDRNLRIFRLLPVRKLNFTIYFLLDQIIGIRWRSYFLAKIIQRNKPGLIHFHEMQHGAYIFNYINSYGKVPTSTRKIVSTWGSDLTLYSWNSEHIESIRECLSWTNILTAEKVEELGDAKRLGFKGDFRAPIYITVGQNLAETRVQTEPSTRKLILIKGHESETGRALNVLKAVSQLKNQLQDLEILVYSAPKSVRIQVDKIRNEFEIDIRILPKVSHDEMCSLFYEARLSISVAVSDGLPGVLVEAMQAGAFPIQSVNSAGKDFIVHGVNGFLVDPWNIESIKDSIVSAITDNSLVDKASTLNKKILREKYSLIVGVRKLRELYL